MKGQAPDLLQAKRLKSSSKSWYRTHEGHSVDGWGLVSPISGRLCFGQDAGRNKQAYAERADSKAGHRKMGAHDESDQEAGAAGGVEEVVEAAAHGLGRLCFGVVAQKYSRVLNLHCSWNSSQQPVLDTLDTATRLVVAEHFRHLGWAAQIGDQLGVGVLSEFHTPH